MYQDFVVVDVATDLINKQLDIFFNFDVDPSTVIARSLQIIETLHGRVIPIQYSVDNMCIHIILSEDPVPNINYSLICNKEICTITHQPLKTEYLRYIQFSSTIKNTVNILTPAELEKVSVPNIVWQENKFSGADFINRYHVQISRDNNGNARIMV